MHLDNISRMREYLHTSARLWYNTRATISEPRGGVLGFDGDLEVALEASRGAWPRKKWAQQTTANNNTQYALAA